MAPSPARDRFAERFSLIFLALALAVSGCGDTNVGKAESVAALAGAGGGPGYFDGSLSDPVRFDSPSGVAVVGTDRFVADTENHVIRRIDAAGNVSTFAGTFGVPGSADGTGAAARFRSPAGIVADGTILFVCDTGNHTIRRIAANGTVTTLAGSAGNPGAIDNTAGANARFRSPKGIATAAGGLFVADSGNHTIRRVTTGGAVTTYAGLAQAPGTDNGIGTAARFRNPEGVAAIGGTETLFVTDTGNHTIRMIVSAGVFGNVTTTAGSPGTSGTADGAGPAARFNSPGGIAAIGSDLYVADTGNHTVRKVDFTGTATTLAGQPGIEGFLDGTGASSLFRSPAGIGTDGSSLFVGDTGNHTVRRVTVGGTVTSVAGNPPRRGKNDGSDTSARFNAPLGAAVVGDEVFVADTGNHSLRKITAAGIVTTLAGLSESSGLADGTGSAARFNAPEGITAVGTTIYVADTGNHVIRKVTSAGEVTILAGSPSGTPGNVDSATGTNARFRSPKGIATDGTDLYVVDAGNNAVRKVTAAGAVTTLAGSAGSFDDPRGAAFLGGALYVADAGDHTIRKVLLPSGTVSVFAGSAGNAGFDDRTGGDARFSSPAGITAADSVLYVADAGNHAVRRISTSRRVTTFAGDPDAATTRNGAPTAALMNAPTGIAGVQGTIYFTDANENVVRKILF